MREMVICTGNWKSAGDRVRCCSSVSLRGQGSRRSVAGARESGLAQKAASLPQGLPVRAGPFFGRRVITDWLFFLCCAAFNRQSGAGVPGQTQHAWADAHSQRAGLSWPCPRSICPPRAHTSHTWRAAERSARNRAAGKKSESPSGLGEGGTWNEAVEVRMATGQEERSC